MQTLAIRGKRNPNRIASEPAIQVGSFEELMSEVARLNHAHADQCIFYRGQQADFPNSPRRCSSSILPGIYRGITARNPVELWQRYDRLQRATDALQREWSMRCLQMPRLGGAEIIQSNFVRWSILQHYEACRTPMLDLTQSVGVACSFALNPDRCGGHPAVRRPHVYAFGLPYPMNRISADPDADLVNVRLLSVCPPAAMRPRYQEGFTVFPKFAEPIDLSRLLPSADVKGCDFNRRLLAKYELVGWDPERDGGGWYRTREQLCLDEDPSNARRDTAHEVVKAVRNSIDEAGRFITVHERFLALSAELFFEVLSLGAAIDQGRLGGWRKGSVSVAHVTEAARVVHRVRATLGSSFWIRVAEAFERRATLLSARGDAALEPSEPAACECEQLLEAVRRARGSESD